MHPLLAFDFEYLKENRVIKKDMHDFSAKKLLQMKLLNKFWNFLSKAITKLTMMWKKADLVSNCKLTVY